MIVAVTMVRDEADVIGFTLAHLLAEGVDHIIVADNLSSDDTRDICDLYAEKYPVTVLDDPDPAYEQARKMTRLARMAYGMGATWVLPFDADEVIYSPHGRLADFFATCTFDIVDITGYDHIATDRDADVANPFMRITHRRAYPQTLPKVAFRADPDVELEMGNHGVDFDGSRTGGLELRHFQFRSYEQMRRKYHNGKAAYDATDPGGFVGLNYRRGYFGTHWARGGSKTDDELMAEWAALCTEADLIDDPAPVRSL